MKFIIIIFMLFVLCGCIIPIKVITERSSKDMAFERQKLYKEIARTNYYRKLEQKEKYRTYKTKEHNIILESFKNSNIILKAFEKTGVSIFDIAVFLNEYGKNDIDGFCDYLETKYPFNQCQRWRLDEVLFEPAKRNYKLLEKINKKEGL